MAQGSGATEGGIMTHPPNVFLKLKFHTFSLFKIPPLISSFYFSLDPTLMMREVTEKYLRNAAL